MKTILIALMGVSGSGKTTLQKALCAEPEVYPVNFASPVKRFIADRYGVPVESLDTDEGKAALVYPLVYPDHPMYGVTYRELLIRWWKASPGLDPMLWPAESQAEIDSLIEDGAKALVFADVRNWHEVDMINRLVAEGHPLTVVSLSREDEQARDSDRHCREFTEALLNGAEGKPRVQWLIAANKSVRYLKAFVEHYTLLNPIW
jgi:hypothetical protein